MCLHTAYSYLHVLHRHTKNSNNLIIVYMQKKNKIKNLLHQGREVQEGREVQAVQAGRAYHRYQGDQEDPAKKKSDKKNQKSDKIRNRAIEWTECINKEMKTQHAPHITWLPRPVTLAKHISNVFLCVSSQVHRLPIMTKAALHLEEVHFILPPQRGPCDQPGTGCGPVTSWYRKWVNSLTL